MMLDEHDERDKCVIARISTHECIERLWRDVHRSVVVTCGNLFRILETEGQLTIQMKWIYIVCIMSFHPE